MFTDVQAVESEVDPLAEASVTADVGGETAPTTTTTTTTSSTETGETETTATTSSSSGPSYYEVNLQETMSGQPSKIVALNGVDLINQYLSMIYLWMASLIGLLAVLMIVVSGIQIIFGGASPELVSDAKNRILQSLLSLILLFATALILKTVNPGFFF